MTWILLIEDKHEDRKESRESNAHFKCRICICLVLALNQVCRIVAKRLALSCAYKVEAPQRMLPGSLPNKPMLLCEEERDEEKSLIYEHDVGILYR